MPSASPWQSKGGEGLPPSIKEMKPAFKSKNTQHNSKAKPNSFFSPKNIYPKLGFNNKSSDVIQLQNSETKQVNPPAPVAPCKQSSIAQAYKPSPLSTPIKLGSKQFGNTSKLAAYFSFDACKVLNKWRFYLKSITVNIGSEVQPLNFRVNVASANDPAVTKASYQAIVNDLKPNLSGKFSVQCGAQKFVDNVTNYSRRRKFWNRQLVVDHEAYHYSEWNKMYKEELIKAEQKIWQHSIPENTANNAGDAIAKERQNLDKYMIDAYVNTCTTYAPQQESRAYTAGAPQYQKLVDQIKARAVSEKW